MPAPHQSFYRKHRPTKFKNVIGQTIITNVLCQQIQRHKINHSYLFSGIQGVGKTTSARILARAINCLNNQLGEPCETCQICQQSKNNFVDIIEIDAASNNGVEQIRALRAKVLISPSLGKYKIYIIDEVHMLSRSAYNAFLKILEEPPRHIVFILATTEIFKIPETIMSRCQIFLFHPITENDMTNFLTDIAKTEGIVCESGAIEAITQHAQGSVRDALNFLEQMRFLQKGFPLTALDVEHQLGKTNANLRFEFIDNLLLGNKQKVLETIDELIRIGVNFPQLKVDLIEQINEFILKQYRLDEPNPKWPIDKLKTILTVLLSPKYNFSGNALRPNTLFQLMIIELFTSLHKQIFTKNQTPTDYKQKIEQINKQNAPSIHNSEYQNELNILLNKNNLNIKAVTEQWTQLAVYSGQKSSKPYIETLLKARIVTASSKEILLVTKNNETVRNKINGWKNDLHFKKLVRLIFAENYQIYAVTDDELMMIKLKYEQKK